MSSGQTVSYQPSTTRDVSTPLKHTDTYSGTERSGAGGNVEATAQHYAEKLKVCKYSLQSEIPIL
jgi:hypothetical protein